MTERDPRGLMEPAPETGREAKARPEYVRPVVQTYSAEEILAEFGPAMACSGTTPCPVGDD